MNLPDEGAGADHPNRHLLSLIERRLRELELSERQACMRAGLQLDSIRGLRRGYKPNLRKLRQLAPVLELQPEYLLSAAALDDERSAVPRPDLGDGDETTREATRVLSALMTPAGEAQRSDLTLVVDRTAPFDRVLITPGYVPDMSFKAGGETWLVEVKRVERVPTAYVWPLAETPHVRRAEVEFTHTTPGSAAALVNRLLTSLPAAGERKAVFESNRYPERPPTADDIPIFYATETETGATIDFDKPVRFVARPETVRSVPDAFGLYVLVDRMSPRYTIGDVVVVDPARPARPGDDVLVMQPGGTGDTGWIRRFVGRDGGDVVLEQLNPPQTHRLPSSRVARLHPIVAVLYHL